MPDSDALRLLLGGAMRDTREGRGVSLADMAERIGSGITKSYLSEAERGIKPASARIVRAYDQLLGCDGVLVGLYEDYVLTLGSESERSTGPQAQPPRGSSRVVGDEVEFVSESPDAVEVLPGLPHVKSWTVLNAGSTAWEGRRLWRTGRLSGREVPASEEFVPIPRTLPGETVDMKVNVHCAREAGTRILRFKMIDAEGRLCFPEDSYGVTFEVISRPDGTPQK